MSATSELKLLLTLKDDASSQLKNFQQNMEPAIESSKAFGLALIGAGAAAVDEHPSVGEERQPLAEHLMMGVDVQRAIPAFSDPTACSDAHESNNLLEDRNDLIAKRRLANKCCCWHLVPEAV